jgi:hypothetical protein
MIIYEDLRAKKYTEEDLEKHINDFTKDHWSWISEYQKLSESFIEEFKDKVDWLYISRCQILSEPFIEKYKEKLERNYISQYQKLSESFILNNIEYIDVYFLGKNKSISNELLEKVEFMKELGGY